MFSSVVLLLLQQEYIFQPPGLSWTSVTSSGGSDSLSFCEASFTLGSEVKVELPLIAILDGSMLSWCPITSSKMSK